MSRTWVGHESFRSQSWLTINPWTNQTKTHIASQARRRQSTLWLCGSSPAKADCYLDSSWIKTEANHHRITSPQYSTPTNLGDSKRPDPSTSQGLPHPYLWWKRWVMESTSNLQSWNLCQIKSSIRPSFSKGAAIWRWTSWWRIDHCQPLGILGGFHVLNMWNHGPNPWEDLLSETLENHQISPSTSAARIKAAPKRRNIDRRRSLQEFPMFSSGAGIHSPNCNWRWGNHGESKSL